MYVNLFSAHRSRLFAPTIRQLILIHS